MSSRARAERDQAVEQPPAGAVAETRDGRRGGDGVVGEQRLDGARLPLGAQFWRGVREPGRPARQVLGQVEGGERRPCISERHELPQPASPGRGRRPSPAARRANSSLARSGSGVGQPRFLASAASAQKIASGSASGRSADHRFGGRGRDDRGRPAAPARLPERGGELRRLFRVERRLQVGRDGGEALGAERIAGTREDAEGGIDPSRRPEILPGPREGDRVAQRRLVLAPVEQVLRHRGGAFQRQAAAPDAGPRRVGFGDGIERGKRRAGEKQRLGLGILAKRPARARPGGRARQFQRGGLGANHRRNRSRRRRLWPPCGRRKRPTCRPNSMSDNVVLSDAYHSNRTRKCYQNAQNRNMSGGTNIRIKSRFTTARRDASVCVQMLRGWRGLALNPSCEIEWTSTPRRPAERRGFGAPFA